jgi:hypothetical protein
MKTLVWKKVYTHSVTPHDSARGRDQMLKHLIVEQPLSCSWCMSTKGILLYHVKIKRRQQLDNPPILLYHTEFFLIWRKIRLTKRSVGSLVCVITFEIL